MQPSFATIIEEGLGSLLGLLQVLGRQSERSKAQKAAFPLQRWQNSGYCNAFCRYTGTICQHEIVLVQFFWSVTPCFRTLWCSFCWLLCLITITLCVDSILCLYMYFCCWGCWFLWGGKLCFYVSGICGIDCADKCHGWFHPLRLLCFRMLWYPLCWQSAQKIDSSQLVLDWA